MTSKITTFLVVFFTKFQKDVFELLNSIISAVRLTFIDGSSTFQHSQERWNVIFGSAN